jgi:large subunit ribosomal protein L4
MVSLPVYDRSGAEVGTYQLDPSELAPRISKQLLHDVVVMYQANLRQGSSKTKSRAEVRGSTAKMYRQKGTGRARAGSRKSGIRVGGGHIFAKRPRDWSYRLPKKAVRLATRMALASRIIDNEITLIDDLAFEQPKTRQMALILKALKIEGISLLVAVAGYDPNVYRSIRNLVTKTKLKLSPHQVILRPLVTEKGMHKAGRCNAYTFEVNRLSGKEDIRRAIEELFNVKVIRVNTQNRKGKPRRTRFRWGKTKAWKKAIVTLASEDRIDFF